MTDLPDDNTFVSGSSPEQEHYYQPRLDEDEPFGGKILCVEAKPDEESAQSKQKLVAFGGFVKPSLYGIFGEHNLENLTEAEKSWMTAEKLRELVLSPQQNDRFLVDDVSLNTYEYNLIARSPSQLGKFASARVLHDNDLDDLRVKASNRAPIHVFEQKIAGMQAHGEKLNDRKNMLRELQKEVKTPGYAHKTPERMSQLIAAVWNEFMVMLDVIHLQRDWDDNKRQRAESALIGYLNQGAQRQRVANWSNALGVVDNYLTQRILLFRRKTQFTQHELERYQKTTGDGKE